MFQTNFLQRFGIAGWDDVEPYLLAGLVLREPILLVGEPGTGKTYVATALGKALGLNYHVYDASKGMFEDIIGFPDYSNGKVEYIPTKLSVWGRELIFVDEISRASPEMQNKWLELIRSRSVMGIPVPTLKYIIAGMNPPGYLGVIGVDLALVDRFAWIIKVPNAGDFDRQTLKKVVTTVTFMDRVGSKTGKDIGKIEELAEFLEESENRFLGLLNSELDIAIANVLSELPMATYGTPFEEFINNRRLSMMRRALLSYFAVTSPPENPGELMKSLFNLLPYIIPWNAKKAEPISDYIALLQERFDPLFENNTYLKRASIVEMEEEFWNGNTVILPFLIDKLRKVVYAKIDDEDLWALKPVALKIILNFQRERKRLSELVSYSLVRAIDELYIETTNMASDKWWKKKGYDSEDSPPSARELMNALLEKEEV